MLIPLYGFLEGDTIGLLVLAQDEDPLGKVALSLMQAAAMRVPPFEEPKVYFCGKLLDPEATVTQAGLQPLDRIDVRQKDSPWHSTP